MPPPNVTGSLHIGHALDNTLQDILTRHARMQGKDALVGGRHRPCRDRHADGRRAQSRRSQGVKRTDFGREAVRRAGVGVEGARAAAQITRQLRRLGASLRLGQRALHHGRGLLASAVTHVFVELYKRRLLYRDKRLVNWDPKFQTAISDLEVETREVQGKFWHFAIRSRTAAGHVESPRRGPRRCSATWRSRSTRATSATRALVGKQCELPITGPADPDHHRRACRSGASGRAR